MYFTTPFAGHKIGDLRLAYTQDASPTAGDGSITWIELTPGTLLTFRDDSSLSIDGSNIVSVAGSTAVSDVYQVVATLDEQVEGITGFRLEANPLGDAFGFGAGNFVLVEFQAFAAPAIPAIPEPASALLATAALLALRRRRRRG
jgi:hypothetical protein